EALQLQSHSAGVSFAEQVLSGKRLSAQQLAVFASRAFGVPMLDLGGFDFDQLNREYFDTRIAQTRRVLPLHKRGNRLYVATSDPANLQALDEVRFKTNLVVEPVVVEDDKLAQAIAKIVESMGANLKELAALEDIEVAIEEGTAQPSATEEDSEVEDAPVVRYIQKVLIDAITSGASDIHFEPYEKFYRIRYRLDGVLMEVAQPPLAIKDKVASRIKVISKLDIAEKRVPQDGRMKLVLSKTKAIDFRVSTLPTLFGEKIVMRILDSSGVKLGIEALGYEPDQQQALLFAVGRPYGMILVTGPTGSGKTVSLYSCLSILNQPGVNIATAEDPAEIQLPGVNQVNVNEKAGLTFALALRAFLRQDPDVIMVGEIRDLETAEIAIKAAQTGHLVMSTVHTNDAPSTLVRMMNMGVAPFNIASSVNMITAQRLARKLCTHCRRPEDIPPEALLRAGFTEEDLDGSWQPWGPIGCDHCKGTGYKGRIGIYEVMPISDEMKQLIMRNGNTLDLAQQARREGVRDLRQSGLLKVKSGITSLEEIEAVTNE
ncbi:MAG TPA: type IV-A pilus assembly ATPase PilB, partial [Casimicrobiaceae bacterium]|nr:type IV-A pilus assembly ATPase PilB [Casimicrobiaceae bacterium]